MFFQFFRKSRVKKKKKTRNFFTAHQNNLIQSVENNLTIISVQEWRFFVKSEQSYQFFRFSTNLTSTNEVSERTLNKKTHEKFLIGASE